MRILIIEDDGIQALALAEVLQQAGHTILDIAHSAAAAVARAAELQPDLVLSDIRLGRGGDGIAAVEQIVAARPVPHIYLTAFGGPLTVARAQMTEPLAVMDKPYDSEELVGLIAGAAPRGRNRGKSAR